MALPISSKPKANIFSSTVLSTPDSASQKGFGWKAFMQALGVLKEVSVVFPPLQAAASGLFRVLENLQVNFLMNLSHDTTLNNSSKEIQDARGDLEMMARRIETLANFLQGYEGRTNDEDMLNRLDGMTASVFPII
ncbi:hypothetical protein DFH09DRAFT_1075510 [Mycena vulgaris]|nr:hypothetical protein DFH09DRAFT_1075510 [Mycena vulgaris]